MTPRSPQLLSAAFAAANFVAVSQILTRDHVPCLLFACVVVFAATIPLNLLVYVLDDDFTSYYEGQHTDRLHILTTRFFGLSALNIAGFTLLFFHFGFIPGFTFLGVTLSILFVLFSSSDESIWRTVVSVFTGSFRRLPPKGASCRSDNTTNTKA